MNEKEKEYVIVVNYQVLGFRVIRGFKSIDEAEQRLVKNGWRKDPSRFGESWIIGTETQAQICLLEDFLPLLLL